MPDMSKPLALTQLGEEEIFFRNTVRRFAAAKIAPIARAMDEAQKIDPGLLTQLFEMGLMGIEIPEALGGSGGTFFDAILAVEALSAVDPSIGVLVDVQNTLTINALLRWGNDEQKGRFLPRMAKDMVASYALSEASSGSDAFADRKSVV